MKTSYNEADVKVLLKDITGQILPLNSKEREIQIQNGKHYSELLPFEYNPTEEYLNLYNKCLAENALVTAKSVMILAEKIYLKKGENITLVSLARAGTPIGILLKRYFKFKYNISVEHYSISIIRDKGIDRNAMEYILKNHSADSIQFVDGWIGKGAISKELDQIGYENIDTELAVLADPANVTSLFGTREDFLIPSSILNAPVSGLFSRTILNDDLILKDDFHGAVFYKDMIDVSNEFIAKIEQNFTLEPVEILEKEKIQTGLEEVLEIQKEFNVLDINLIKPSIGETTRVLMRRQPDLVLISEENHYITHILKLCEEKNVKVIKYPLKNYRAVGIIKNLKDI